MYDDEPELAGYEPGDGRPLRSARTLLAMRLVVIVGLIGFILPGIVTIVSVSADTARRSCARWVGYERPDAPASDARLELFGYGGPGWQCYTKNAFGGDKWIAPLGLIPAMPVLPNERPASS
ncbi:hypothetical protein [Galbitalea soli]|uniref:Uncharacterized protein n=1 Tax=Galbitalea soli TaxID=1268042 RepID=A0A7C9TR26_9MICO|nr:hypothetical protein [Galbitalea soli]NEM90723.1 hypothetical protein [Galbitalea soli]